MINYIKEYAVPVAVMVCAIGASVCLSAWAIRLQESRSGKYRQFLSDKNCVLSYADTTECRWDCGGVETVSRPQFCREWLNGK